MALTRDQIDDLAEEGVFLGNVYEISQAIEAEVRKDDERLIRKLLAALENHDGNYKLSKSAGAAVDAAITAARARLEKAP